MAHHLRRDPGELVQKKRKQDKHDNFDRLKGEMEMFRNRLISVLLTVFLLISLPACAAMSETAEGTDYDEVFVIVHTNDVHGFIDVEPYVKAVADDMKAQYGENNVVTVSAGDVFSGGNAVAHLYNGETIPPIMEAAGYDILAPGNNDLFLGRDQLLVLAGMFDHTKVLCANLFEQALDENGEPVLDECDTFASGKKLAHMQQMLHGELIT